MLGQALELLRDSKPARLTEPKDHEEKLALDRGAIADRQAGPLRLQRRRGRCGGRQRAQRARVREGRGGGREGGGHLGGDRGRDRDHGRPTTAPNSSRDLGLDETGLARVIRAGYDLLHLITFFTAGPKEARAWTVEKGAKAPQAAGVIHTDFERGFIRAETIAYDDFVACSGEAGAREAGKLRSEGKDYVVQDGDVMLFRFNV